MVAKDPNNAARDPRTIIVPILSPGGGMVSNAEGIPLLTTLYEQQRGEEHDELPPMKAVVIHEAGGPEVLEIETRPIPFPYSGDDTVLIKVKAFGLNRSELFTRQGHSPSVKFPRILGIEAVGILETKVPQDSKFEIGDYVATAMGGMGRDFDGSYAEYLIVPESQISVIDPDTTLDWGVLGALPLLLETAWGSLFKSLQFKSGDSLLIRGGTTSVGLAAAAIARKYGASYIASTTRKTDEATVALLKKSGADHVFVDNGDIHEEVQRIRPGGFDKVLELVGTTTLQDSLKCARTGGGIVSMTGIVGNSWTLDDFNPMEFIPTGVCLTSYSGGAEDFIATPLNQLIKLIESGDLHIQIGKTFKLEEIVDAHKLLDSNKANGKIVVLT